MSKMDEIDKMIEDEIALKDIKGSEVLPEGTDISEITENTNEVESVGEESVVW